MYYKRPFDPVGTMATNRVVGEIHPLNTNEDKAFVLELGAFYSDTLILRDSSTGDILTLEEDYKLLNASVDAIKISGKRVDTVVFMLNTDFTAVEVDYQAVGGIYSVLSMAVIDLLEQNKNAVREPIYWATILNKPDEITPVAHTHDFSNLYRIDDGINALTKVLENIYQNDLIDYRDVYDYLYTKIKAITATSNLAIDEVNGEIDILAQRSKYVVGDIIVGDFDQNPGAYFPEVNWVLIPDVLLYGNTSNSANDPATVDVVSGVGHIARRTHIYVAIAKDGPGYALSRSATNIDEGQSVQITLTVTQGTPGMQVPYVITGISEDDIDIPLDGYFTIDGTGVASVTIQALQDNKTEGAEVLRLTLLDNPSVYTSVTINDTSLSPTFDTYYSSDAAGTKRVTSVNEGDVIYFQVRANNSDPNQVLNMYYGGTTLTSDFVEVFPTTLTLSGGSASFQITVIADKLTEGNKVLLTKVSVSTEANSIAQASITVLDTSRTPIYRARFSGDSAGSGTIAAINEGSTCYLVIETANVADGTPLTLQYSGTTTVTDFSSTRPVSATVSGGSVIIPYVVNADYSTEGQETLIVNIFNNALVVASATITVLDTSVNPDLNVRFSSSNLGIDYITSADEGTSIYLVVTTSSDIPNQTVYQLSYEGTANAADFDSARATSVTIVKQRGVIQYDIKADGINDGEKIMRVRITDVNTNSQIGMASITINDTSVAPTQRCFYSASATSDTAITSVNEGDTCYFTVITTNTANGTVYNVEQLIAGRAALTTNGDVTTNPATSVTINSNRASIPITMKADMVTDGDKSLVGILKNGTAEITRAEIVVKDTSVAPTYSISFSSTADGNTPLTGNVLEGQTFYMVVNNTSVVSGTTLYFGYTGNPGNLTNLPTTMVQGASNISIFPVKAALNFIALGYSVSAQLCTDVGLKTVVGTASVTVTGNSGKMYFSSNSNGTTTITNATEGDIIYLVTEAKNTSGVSTVADGSVVNITTLINGLDATTANGFVTENVATSITMTNGRAITPIKTTTGLTALNVTLSSRINNTNVVANGTIKRVIREWVVNFASFTPTYSAEGYRVFEGVDLWAMLVSVTGSETNILVGDTVTYTVPTTTAVIGSDTVRNGMSFDSRFNNVTVNVVNNGLIFGRGGNAIRTYKEDYYPTIPGYPTMPGIGIVNTSSIVINVNNTGWISGGGAYGGASDSVSTGGIFAYGSGGAPFGKKAQTINKWNGSNDSTGAVTYPGTLLSGGAAPSWPDGVAYAGGNVGEYSVPASNGANRNPPGAVFSGNVVIANSGSGKTTGL